MALCGKSLGIRDWHHRSSERAVFCGHCNRIRLTADGKVRTCLFSVTEHDLRSLLRGSATDEQLNEWLNGVVQQKEARHHIGEPDFQPASRSMSCIGG